MCIYIHFSVYDIYMITIEITNEYVYVCIHMLIYTHQITNQLTDKLRKTGKEMQELREDLDVILTMIMQVCDIYIHKYV